MAAKETLVILKQSGESFNGGSSNGEYWTPKARFNIASGIAKAVRKSKELGLSGIVVVPGAGNIARGRTLGTTPHPDTYGRLFIFANATILTHDLEKLGVKVTPMAAPGMEFKDKHINFCVYNPEKVLMDCKKGRVIIMGGGMGADDRSSDYAAVYYANRLNKMFSGGVVILKSTKFDGVFGQDPAKINAGEPNPHYKIISAIEMLADYQKFSAVDKPSLELLANKDLTFRIYAEEEHTLTEVLEQKKPIGTLIVGSDHKAILYP